MKKSLPVFAAIVSVCVTALAQDAPSAPKPAAAKTAAAPPQPSAQPAAESPGILKKLFGSRRGRQVLFPPKDGPAPTPDTAPPSAPAAKAVAKKVPKTSVKTAKAKPRKPAAAAEGAEPAPATVAAADTAPGVAPAVGDGADPAAAPAPAPVAPKTAKSRKGKTAPSTAAQAGVEPPADADPDAKEKFLFDKVKAEAAADPEVTELKTKADSAVFDQEGKDAQRAYNKALYNKMRKIDGSLEERINAVETAILKRLE